MPYAHDRSRSARPLRPLRRPLRARNADVRPAAAHRALRRTPAAIPSSRSSSTTTCAHYVGRPSPLYFAERLTKEAGGARIYLKREDLNHTGAHKINNCIGQALLTQRMGKPRIIAETGAGQHGVATATAAALFGLKCQVYMGEEDVRRQKLNVFKMKAMGTEVVPVTSGSRTLRDAINEAMRDWMATRRAHALHHRQRRRPAPVPDDGPRLPVGHRPGDAGSSASSRSAGCPTSSSPASAAAATRPACSTRSSTTRRSSWSASRPAAAAPNAGEHAATLSHGKPGVLHGTLQLRPAGRRRPDRRRPLRLRRPRLPRRRPRAQLLEGHRPRPLHQRQRRRGPEGVRPVLPAGRHPARAGDGPRRRRGDAHRGASAAKEDVVVVCFSGRGDKDCFEVARLMGEEIEE